MRGAKASEALVITRKEGSSLAGFRYRSGLLDIDCLDGINQDHGDAIGDDVVSCVGHTLQTIVSSCGL
jgi:GGDEF domain-containing protein